MYIVYNTWGHNEFYLTNSAADAEELILSLWEEDVWWCYSTTIDVECNEELISWLKFSERNTYDYIEGSIYA